MTDFFSFLLSVLKNSCDCFVITPKMFFHRLALVMRFLLRGNFSTALGKKEKEERSEDSRGIKKKSQRRTRRGFEHKGRRKKKRKQERKDQTKLSFNRI